MKKNERSTDPLRDKFEAHFSTLDLERLPSGIYKTAPAGWAWEGYQAAHQDAKPSISEDIAAGHINEQIFEHFAYAGISFKEAQKSLARAYKVFQSRKA